MIDVSCFQCSFVCDELDGRFARMLNQSTCALSHLFLMSLQSSLSLSLSMHWILGHGLLPHFSRDLSAWILDWFLHLNRVSMEVVCLETRPEFHR